MNAAAFQAFNAVRSSSADTPSRPDIVACVYLYQNAFYAGVQFSSCGQQGTVQGYAYLSDYAFNNIASSNYMQYSSGKWVLYDSYQFIGLLTTLIGDVSVFGPSYNDKASSVKAYR